VDAVHILAQDVDSVNMSDDTRPYHHGDLREALVTAGLALARSQGPDALAVRALAKQVGVTPNAVYRHFADLEHLRAAVAQRAREELLWERVAVAASSDVDGASDADRARERLVRMGRAYVEFAREEPNLFATALRPNAIPPDRPDDPDGWTIVAGVLDEMVAAGALSPELREVAPWFIWSIGHGLASLVVSTEMPVGLEVEVERIVSGVFDRMLRGLLP
jgi:AcrR family transcriptional regulator